MNTHPPIPVSENDAFFLEHFGVVEAVYGDLRARGFQIRREREPVEFRKHRLIDWAVIPDEPPQ